MKYLISSRLSLRTKLESQIGPPHIAVDEHNWDDYKSCTYLGVEFSELPPIDSNILYDFIHCEIIFLKMADRLLPLGSYQQRKDEYIKHLRFWNHKITRDLDFAIFQNIPHEGFDFVIYSICKARNIKTLCFYSLPIRPNKVYLMHPVQDIFKSGQEIGDTYLKLNKEIFANNISIDNIKLPIRNYIYEYNDIDRKVISFTRSEYKKTFQKEIMRVIKRAGEYIANLKIKLLIIDTIKYFIRRFLSESVLARITSSPLYYETNREVEDYYERNAAIPNLDLPYIYFPLHYQPECSTSPLGGEYANQYLVCEMLAYVASSHNILIYVKEHPRASKAVHIRNIAFYEKMLNCKNVVLVEKSTDSLDLIDKSVAVATITGSAGWEAVLRLKNVLMFGSRFYELAPGVFKIKSCDDLSNALNLILSKQGGISQQALIVYLKAVEEHAFEAFVNQADERIATVSKVESDKNFISAIINYISANGYLQKMHCNKSEKL